MFTGIVEDLGTVETVQRSRQGAAITIRTGLPLSRVGIGDSIAVSGVCLTVVGKSRSKIRMDLAAETLRRTILGTLEPGDRVNLERCLTLNKFLSGHLMAGHVDGVGKIVSIKPEGDSKLYTFEVAASEAAYLVEKGSAAIDGISLTVFNIRGRRFSCALIPHTMKATTLGYKKAGDKVNIESDMLVKYVARVVGARGLTALKSRRPEVQTLSADGGGS